MSSRSREQNTLKIDLLERIHLVFVNEHVDRSSQIKGNEK